MSTWDTGKVFRIFQVPNSSLYPLQSLMVKFSGLYKPEKKITRANLPENISNIVLSGQIDLIING